MAKNAKTPRKKEIMIEKNIRRRDQIDRDFALGDSFVEEPTGSAAMVNVDGREQCQGMVRKHFP